MGLIPPQFLAIGGAVLLLLGIVAGWTVRDWKADAEQLAAVQHTDKVRDQMQARIDDGSARFESFRASLAPQAQASHDTIREFYRNAPPVPANCAAPDPVVGLLGMDIAAANAAATGQSGGALPGAARAPDPAD